LDERVRQLIVDGYAAVGSGDIDGALAPMHPEIELTSSGAFLDEGITYRGREGVRGFFTMIADAFDDLAYDLLELVELDDDRVFVRLRVRGRGKGSGIEVDREGAHIWTVRDYQAVRMVAYADVEGGRAAAGLT
jgi:ketosteroid isomerase-like protein